MDDLTESAADQEPTSLTIDTNALSTSSADACSGEIPGPLSHSSLLRFGIVVLSLIFAVELAVMWLLLPLLPRDTPIWVVPLIDAALLVAFASAPLWWLVGRRLRNAIDALHASEARRRAAIDELRLRRFAMDRHAIVSETDAAGRMTYVSDTFCRISGYARDELLGRNHRIVNSGHHPREFWTQMYVTLARDGVWQGEVCNRAKDGSHYWVQSTNVALKDATGRIIGYLSLRADITERKRAEERLREAHDHAVAINTDLLALNETHEALFACRSASDVARVLTDVLVRRFDARFARVWLRRPADICGECALAAQCPAKQECLHLVASSGFYTHLDGGHRRVPLGAFKIGLIAQGRGKTISHDVASDERVHDRAWAAEQGLRSFVGPPLMHDGRVIGVMAMFSRKDVPDHVLETLEILAKLGAAALANVELIDSLHLATRAAAAASHAKSEFLANMSHEIRMPMTSILGWSGRLLNPAGSAVERQEAAESIRRNGEHLLRIVDDILDISKIEAGMMKVERIPCSPSRILGDVLSLMRVQAVEKGLELRVEPDGPVPQTAITDPTRLRQMLLNLTGNALKFTSKGGVRITVGLVDGGEPGQRRLRFKVIDTGIGLTPEQQRKLFQPFVQGDSSTTRLYGGSGLGLAISKRLAQMLGGDLIVTSRPGEGSVFTLEIDAGPATDAGMVQGGPELDLLSTGVRNERPPVRLSGRVLLAEDGRDNRRLISMFLQDAGAEVVIAENGEQAVALGRRESFDAILMDMQMPIMDGYAAAGRLRRAGVTTPIIALTAHAMNGDREKCLQSGCTDYLSKPIDERTLLEMVAKYMRRGDAGPEEPETASAAVRGTAEPQPRAADTPSAPLRSELAGNLRLRPVLEEYVAELPGTVAALLDELRASDLENLRRRLHMMKGSGAGYGFPAVSDAAADLEELIRSETATERIAQAVQGLVDLLRSIEGYKETRENGCDRQSAAD